MSSKSKGSRQMTDTHMETAGVDANAEVTRCVPLVFYDGACRLCRREIDHYRRRDRRRVFEWVDISRCQERLSEHAIEYSAAITRLHVIDAKGVTRTGVAAFLCIWEVLPGYRWLAGLIRGLRLEDTLERVYAPLTRWRLRRRCKAGSCYPGTG